MRKIAFINMCPDYSNYQCVASGCQLWPGDMVGKGYSDALQCPFLGENPFTSEKKAPICELTATVNPAK